MSEKNGTAKRQVLHKLTRVQTFKIGRWIEDNYSTLKLYTTKEATERAVKEMEFAIDPQQLRSIIRDMGKEIPFKPSIRGVAASGKPGTDRPKFLARQLYAVAKELEKVCVNLGIEFNEQNEIDMIGLVSVTQGKRVENA